MSLTNLSVTQRAAAAELYIDRGQGADEENLQIFDLLYASKDEIERAYGGSLDWQRLDERRACRIIHRIQIGGYRDETQRPEIHKAMAEAIVCLERALKPYIASLPI